MPDRPPPSEIFRQRLKNARELRGLDQNKLAAKAGLPASSISHFEAGSRKPSFENLRRLAHALEITADYLLGRVGDPEANAAADPLYRHLKNLSPHDRALAQEFLKTLALRETGMSSSAFKLATQKAEKFIAELQIKELPVDPIKIAEEHLGIVVRAKPDASEGVSGMLLRYGNSFGIMYATHVKSEGLQRFSVAHEIGHYKLEGHIDHILPQGTEVHLSRAGFVSQDQYEREADHYAVGLLMPDPMFKKALVGLEDGLPAIEALSNLCRTSLTATAIRYVEKTSIPAAVIMSTGQHIDYCFMSKEMQEFQGLDWPRKGELLPADVATVRFNQDRSNILSAKKHIVETNLRNWFGGYRSIPATEEIVGLGSYGRTLTVICAETFADDSDEEDDDRLQERYTPRFRR